MSKEGIKIASDIFSIMQNARFELLHLANLENNHTLSAHQDIRLCKLFEKANDLVKDEFCNIIMGK